TSVTASIGKSDIGNGAGLNFAVLTVEGESVTAGHVDSAPDQGAWSYQLAAAAPLTLAASSLRAPRSVKAGKTFTVTMLVARSDTTKTRAPFAARRPLTEASNAIASDGWSASRSSASM